MMIKVGQLVSFVPFHQTYADNDRYKYEREPPPPAVGRVFMVNRYGVIFVEYVVNGVTLRETFQPGDIGKKVKIMEEETK
jgi:hypothetical protein